MKTNLVKKIVAGVMAAAIVVGTMMAGSVDAQAAKKKDTFKEYDGYYGEVVKAVRTAPKTVEVYVKQIGPKSLAKKLKKVEVSAYTDVDETEGFRKTATFKKVSKNLYKAVIKDVRFKSEKRVSMEVTHGWNVSSGFTRRFVAGSKVVKAAKNIKWKKVCIKKAKKYQMGYKNVFNSELGDWEKVPDICTEPAEYAYRWVKVK